VHAYNVADLDRSVSVIDSHAGWLTFHPRQVDLLGAPRERGQIVATLRRLCGHLMKYLWLPYVLLYDLRLLVADLAAIHFRGEFIRLRSERPGALRGPGNIARVAVVAIHPTDDTVPFTKICLPRWP
jgi:hypothetical protein